jgi:virulence factor BrkB
VVDSSVLFSWYIANFGAYNATYGSLGAAVGMTMWMWISGIVILLGAELAPRSSIKPRAIQRFNLLHAIIPMIQLSLLSSGHRSCEADFARNKVHLDVVRMGDGLRARYSKPLSAVELLFPFNFVLKRFIEQSLNQCARLFRVR